MINNMPFNYSARFFGGTEYMARYFHKNILPGKNKFYKYQSYIIPGDMPTMKEVIEDERDIIIWLHVYFSQINRDFLFACKDPRFLEKIKYVVVVSEWHKQITKKELNIPDENIFVIPNSFDPLEKNINKFNEIEKIKIIHTSAPDRAVEVIGRSLKYIEEDFEMNIFSNIYPETLNEYDPFKIMDNDPRVMFFGQTPRKVVRNYFKDSHIWVYPPDLFEDTFCISLAEAISAECLPVYPKFAALTEVGSDFGIAYDHSKNPEEHAKIFAESLTKAIKQIKNKEFNPKDQAKTIEDKYSWKVFEKNWENFYNIL